MPDHRPWMVGPAVAQSWTWEVSAAALSVENGATVLLVSDVFSRSLSLSPLSNRIIFYFV